MAPGIIDKVSVHINGLSNGKSALTHSISKSAEHNSVSPASDIAGLLQHLSKYENPALHVSPSHDLTLTKTPVPSPSPTQVLIHVRCTGICGSDLHLWHRGAIGPLRVTCPSILGHEASGIVLAVGSAVTTLKAGDRVAIEPGVPCGKCFLCSSGQYNLCEAVAFAGVCPYAGTIRRFMTHEANYCHKIPDGMTFAQGALLEPLSVILHALSQIHITIGHPALICGAGPIGLTALAAAKAQGAWPLVITDVDASRLRFAEDFVPGVQTYLVGMDKAPIDAAEEIRQLFGCGPRADPKDPGTPAPNEYVAPSTILECTGIESSVVTASYCCRRGGTVMVVGVGKGIMNNLPFMHLSLAEIQLRFINRYRDTWPAGVNALANKRILDLDALVTHTFPLEQAVEAMELSADRTKGAVKVQIVDDTEIETL